MRNQNYYTLTAIAFLLPASGVTARAEVTIAYTKDRAIYTASADGKNAKKICRGDDPCISNDGRFLVYTRNNTAPAAAKPKHGYGDSTEDSTRSLVVRELAGGKEITLPAGGASQVYGARWSPDDRWIAFNVLTAKDWQVAVVHADGTDYRVLTDKLDPQTHGYYLAGWNYHDSAILVQNLEVMFQIDPNKGGTMWRRPVKEVTGEDGPSSDMHCTISTDGKRLVTTHYIVYDEFTNLDGPSSYLTLADFPGGTPKRVTPMKFDVATPFLDLAGETVLLRGFGAKDVTTIKGSDGVKLKLRIYRFDISSGKLTPLIEGGESPTASQG
jgi:hypothetical protein